MIYSSRWLIKPIVFIAFVLCAAYANAQISLIQNAIDKIENYKNFSYQSITKQKDGTDDTLIIKQKGIFLKAPEDKTLAYLFSMETLIKDYKSVDLYNGQNLITIKLADSTYRINQYKAADVYSSSLLGRLKRIKNFLEKKPSNIIKVSDTTINAIAYSHLIVNTYDTIINKDHNYTFTHLFINKLSGLPDCIITKSRTVIWGDGATNSYMENRYSDYKFDQDNVNLTSFTIPKGFNQPKEWTRSHLASGTIAPDWSLYTAIGKKMSLTQMKGKVVLLDFYFIGCLGCMKSLKPLNNLYEKFINQNFTIASITKRDSKQSVLEFEKKYHLKYPCYINAGDVVKSYQIEVFPTFYFIDKEGKIANVIVGYNEDFEEKATLIINDLLNK